jgi:hypothetical protein
MKRYGIAVFALWVLLILQVGQAFAGYDRVFHEKALRMDFVTTGDRLREELTFGRFIEEPIWSGSRVRLIDTFGYGHYRVEVHEATSGMLLYSRGYSNLFVEWQDTKEAKDTVRSFPESIVVPFPSVPVIISIVRYSKLNEEVLIFSTRFVPGETPVSINPPLPYPVIDLLVSGPPERRLDILIIGEGYTVAEREKFLKDCTRFAGYLLGASPFREHQHLISIRGVMPVSAESGVSKPGKGIVRNSALGLSFYTFGSERYVMTEDYQRVRDVAALAPNDQIVILVNSAAYGGGGIYNYYATATSDHRNSDFLLIHEFGHSFAGLADEYYTSEVAYQDFYDKSVEPRKPNITTMVDFGSKWADMVEVDTPVPTPANAIYSAVVGVYEGAGYSEKGIYRPYLNCTMQSAIYDAFCPVCRRAITRMILFVAD